MMQTVKVSVLDFKGNLKYNLQCLKNTSKKEKNKR
jgi:hypothetical protein